MAGSKEEVIIEPSLLKKILNEVALNTDEEAPQKFTLVNVYSLKLLGRTFIFDGNKKRLEFILQKDEMQIFPVYYVYREQAKEKVLGYLFFDLVRGQYVHEPIKEPKDNKIILK